MMYRMVSEPSSGELGVVKVSTRFNHVKLALWAELTESDRTWLGWLGRYADDHELVREWQYRDHAMFCEAYFDDAELRATAFLVESLMLVFATRSSRIALRAMLQAAEYMGQLGDAGRARFFDAFKMAQYRLESVLGVQP